MAAAAPVLPPKLVDSGGKAALARDLLEGAGAAPPAENALLEGVTFAAGGAGAFEEAEAEKGVGVLVARGG